MNNTSRRINPWLVFLIVLALALTLYQRFQRGNRQNNGEFRWNEKNHQPVPFSRKNVKLIYTKHARCRMACRHIDESEVAVILEDGAINYQKSETNSEHPRYALEGITGDGQQVRIVFAPEIQGLVVITCIDLQKEWPCHCN